MKFLGKLLILVAAVLLTGGSAWAVDIDLSNSTVDAVDKDTIRLRAVQVNGSPYWGTLDWSRTKNIFELSGRGRDSTFVVSQRNIVIDGNYGDWMGQDMVYNDTGGADCGNVPGRDIKQVYVAQDADTVFFRYVLNGPFDPSSQYLFGEELHLRVVKDGVNEYIHYSTSLAFASAWFPASAIHFDGNQFEAQFNLCDILPWWHDREVDAWVDQAGLTVCRDLVTLPKLIFDVSSCN